MSSLEVDRSTDSSHALRLSAGIFLHDIVVLVLVATALLVAVGTTAARAPAYAYDAPPVARVGVHESGAAVASPGLFSDVRERFGSSPAAAQGACTTSFHAVVATEAASGEMGMLTEAESSGLQASLDPNKLSHLFDKAQHGFDPLVEQFGSREAVVEEMYRGLQGIVPEAGRFTVTRVIGGQSVVIDGAVVNGVPRIGTRTSHDERAQKQSLAASLRPNPSRSVPGHGGRRRGLGRTS